MLSGKIVDYCQDINSFYLKSSTTLLFSHPASPPHIRINSKRLGEQFSKFWKRFRPTRMNEQPSPTPTPTLRTTLTAATLTSFSSRSRKKTSTFIATMTASMRRHCRRQKRRSSLESKALTTMLWLKRERTVTTLASRRLNASKMTPVKATRRIIPSQAGADHFVLC